MNFLSISMILFAGLTEAAPHQFDDGFVERTLSIVVRDRTAYGEYSIGFNNATLRKTLAGWKTDRDIPAEKIPDAAVSPKPSASKPSAGDTQPDPEDDSIDAQLRSKLEKLAPTAITNQLTITCNGKATKLKAISVGPAPRHPFCILVKFEFDIPDSKTVELKILDKNFLAQSGAFRSAIKARGNATLLRSDAAPILVRAKRIELEDLTPDERKQQTTLTAKIAVLPH